MPTETRLLHGIAAGPQTLADHRALYPAPPRPRRDPHVALIDLISSAGLRGRGGAGFPTAVKWRAVAGRTGPRTVVANGTEGEPPSSKDRLLMGRFPHLVLDGAAIAAVGVGASDVTVCIARDDRDAYEAVRRAIIEREQAEEGVPIRVAGTPPRYVAGEESALVHWLNGGPAMPTEVPPRPFERGVAGQPTLVQNVETLAHVTQIARFGAEWFRQTGTTDAPGTVLLTITGAVRAPGVTELPIGTPISRVIEAAGGPAAPLQAVLVGGFFGTWIDARDAAGLPLSREALAAVGAGPGSGAVVALPEGACGLAETARILAWFSAESAGQCGPCIYGLADLARVADLLAIGRASREDAQRLVRWAGDIEGRGACKHPDGAVRLLRSALDVFRDDVANHLAGRPCPPVAPTITVPTSPQVWR
jgi:NADH:ubiquinone oxidoreductase subunit F (NADH-binding)